MGKIRKLFTEKRKVMSQKSISDLTGSSTPVESSYYIESFLENKNRFLPPINFATASNFAKFGSAKQYSIDSVSRVYGTYPYDGSMTEKIDWLNRSTFTTFISLIIDILEHAGMPYSLQTDGEPKLLYMIALV